MAKKIEVYSTNFCPYCVRAKNLLEDLGLEYTEINLEGKADELKALKERTGQRTVPQIFIDGEFIGGFSELSQLNSEGKL